MDISFEVDSEDFGTSAEHLVPDQVSIQEKPKYAPWHKPRKQWVREKQWWGSISGTFLEGDAQSPEKKTLRYFGLPGEELLDIRHLRNRLCDHNGNISIFGLNNNPESWGRAQEQLSRILDNPNICKTSCVERYGFNDLHSTRATLFKKVRDSGPFDVINLDFCDSVISPCIENTRLQALKNIVDYQLQFHSSPWLLFITTRSSRLASSADAFGILCKLIEKNLSNPEFAEEYISYFSDSINDENGKITLLDPSSLNDDYHSKLLVVGLLKWIFQFSASKNCSAKLTSIVSYDIEGEESSSDMISLCIRFKKELFPAVDHSGLTPHNPNSNSNEYSEPLLAARAIRKIALMKSLDEILASDINLYKEMTKQKMDLLEEAGKNVSDYVENVCTRDLQRIAMTSAEFKVLLENK